MTVVVRPSTISSHWASCSGKIYLVATVWDYRDPRHYALHRFKKCSMLDEVAVPPKDFDLDDYLRVGAFEYVES